MWATEGVRDTGKGEDGGRERRRGRGMDKDMSKDRSRAWAAHAQLHNVIAKEGGRGIMRDGDMTRKRFTRAGGFTRQDRA